MTDIKVIEVFFRNISNWNDWYRIFKGRTIAVNLWNYLDPNKPNGPILKEPKLTVLKDITIFDNDINNKLKFYKLLLFKYLFKKSFYQKLNNWV